MNQADERPHQRRTLPGAFGERGRRREVAQARQAATTVARDLAEHDLEPHERAGRPRLPGPLGRWLHEGGSLTVIADVGQGGLRSRGAGRLLRAPTTPAVPLVPPAPRAPPRPLRSCVRGRRAFDGERQEQGQRRLVELVDVVDGEHEALTVGPSGETRPGGVEQRSPFLLAYADAGDEVGRQHVSHSIERNRLGRGMTDGPGARPVGGVGEAQDFLGESRSCRRPAGR